MGKVVAHHANETSSGTYQVLLQDIKTGKKYNVKVKANSESAAISAARREVANA